MIIDFFDNFIKSMFLFFSFNRDSDIGLIRHHFFNFIWYIFNSFLRNDFVDHIINILSPFYWVLFLPLNRNLSSSSDSIVFSLSLFHIFSLFLLHVISNLIWHFINLLFSHIISHCLVSISSDRLINVISDLFRYIVDISMGLYMRMHFLLHFNMIMISSSSFLRN